MVLKAMKTIMNKIVIEKATRCFSLTTLEKAPYIKYIFYFAMS